jgi:archaellum biogenesis protein FlaJ (TadC family)
MSETRERRSSSESSGESHKERVDRELIELLNELRVALPGVQFLFAFLLIVPFQQTRDQLTDFQRDLYFVALLAAAVATVLLIAPAAQHRILFRQKDKDKLLRRSNVYAIAGLIVLGLAICAAILLVVDVLFSLALAWVAAGAIAVMLAIAWVAIPFWRRSRSEQDDPDDDAEV